MILYNRYNYSIHVQVGMVDDTVFAWMDKVYEDLPKLEEEIDKYEHGDFDNAVMLVLYHYDSPVGVLCGYRHEDTCVEEHFWIDHAHRNKDKLAHWMITYLRLWADRTNCKTYVGKRKGQVHVEECGTWESIQSL